MKEFLKDTSYHGVEFFESKNQNTRKSGYFVFLLAFFGLGFFTFDIYIKYKVNPIINEELNLHMTFHFLLSQFAVLFSHVIKDQIFFFFFML
jgi:hypothetical protein